MSHAAVVVLSTRAPAAVAAGEQIHTDSDAAVLPFAPRGTPRPQRAPSRTRRKRAVAAAPRPAKGLNKQPKLVVHEGGAGLHGRADGRADAGCDADGSLVRAIAGGDHAAMRVLFLRHRGQVFRFIVRMVRDHALADDLTSDVFLGVWKHAHRFEGRARATTWLCAIARHKALTALQERRFAWQDDDQMHNVADPAPGPEENLAADDRMAALRRCIAALSPQHRQIIDRVYYRDQSINEIAEALGIGPATVKTRMFYARKRLAALMAATG
jgi:RNA polymerase sigma-70 factor, ECF subfamily